MNLLFFLPFGSLTPCRTNISLYVDAPLLAYLPFDLAWSHTHQQPTGPTWPRQDSHFRFGILLFLFHYFLPHRIINFYMSFFMTTKTPHSILLKSIILIIITMLVIVVILIFLTIASPILTIWFWIILSISKLIIWCVVLM